MRRTPKEVTRIAERRQMVADLYLKSWTQVAIAGELCGMPRREALRRAHEVLSYLELEEARSVAQEILEVEPDGVEQTEMPPELLAERPELSLTEISSGIGLSKSTTHRLLTTKGLAGGVRNSVFTNQRHRFLLRKMHQPPA